MGWMHSKNSGGWEEGVLAELCCTELNRKGTVEFKRSFSEIASVDDYASITVGPLTARAHFH